MINTRTYRGWWIFLGIALSLLVNEAISDDRELNCGAAAIKYIVSAYGVEYKWTPAGQRNELSVFELRQGLSAHGFESTALREDEDYLKALVTPAILHFKRGHFVVVVPVGNTQFLVKDQNRSEFLSTPEELFQEWSGVVVIPKPPPKHSISIPSLVVRQSKVNIGDVRVSEQKDIKLEVYNVGKKPLSLKSIHVSCGCLAPEREPMVVPPKSRVSVTVNFLGLKSLGPFKKQIFIKTDDVNAPLLSFEVNGEVQGSPIVSPTVLNFGKLNPGEVRTKRLKVSAKNYSNDWQCRIEFEDQRIKDEFQWKLVNRDDGLIVEVRREESNEVGGTTRTRSVPVLGKLEIKDESNIERIGVPLVVWRE